MQKQHDNICSLMLLTIEAVCQRMLRSKVSFLLKDSSTKGMVLDFANTISEG